MHIMFNTTLNFKRRLESTEEADYYDVLKKGRELVSGSKNNRDILIVPTASLPQASSNNTGVGNLASDESQAFLNFAKKYWGINEVQILPIGQYYRNGEQYPLYSGTTMDFGNHVVDIKSLLTKEDYEKLVKENKISDRVNFSNVVDYNSYQEKLLKEMYENLSGAQKADFEKFKTLNRARLLPKGLFRALCDKYGSSDYKNWDKIDSHLFDDRVVSAKDREKRISEILKTKGKITDYYIFKQFLAEISLKKSKTELNKNGLRLNGDMPCGFSYDEVWANPKAFLKDYTNIWGTPVLDYSSKDAEKLLREKVRLYSEFFDGFRVDAAWVYTEPRIKNLTTGKYETQYWGDRFLKIIEDEAKNVKGKDFDLKNIMYEFAAEPSVFSVYDDLSLKPYVEKRVKIYTSDYLSEDWGAAKTFSDRGWSKDLFILGAANHDSKEIKYDEKQAEILGKILKKSKLSLRNFGEFLNAKFAEPLSGVNNMIFFMPAMGMKGQYKDNADLVKNYTAKIPADYEDYYIRAVGKNEAYNPMYCLEQQFKAQGLDKKNPELYEKIIKYKEILQDKNSHNKNYFIAAVAVLVLGVIGEIYLLLSQKNSNRRQ